MAIRSDQMPTLMNHEAKKGAALTMAATEVALKQATYTDFIRTGEALNALSFTMTDYEPGGPLPQWLEGRPLEEYRFYEGYSQKLSANHFGGKFLLSWVTLKAGKTELINAGPKMLSKAEAMTREILGHALLVYGGTALASVPAVDGVPMVNPICGDGQPIFSASHRWRTNSTVLNSNIITSYIHPTQTGVNYVQKQISRWRQPNNEPMLIQVDSLILPPEFKLLSSVFQASAKDPLSANNAENLFNKMVPGGVKIHPHLPSTSDWYATTSAKDRLPILRELAAPSTEPLPYDPRTKDSGVSLVTSYAMGPDVNSWMSLFSVSGTPSTVSNTLL